MNDQLPSGSPPSGVRRVFENLYGELRGFAEGMLSAHRNLMPSISKTELTNEAYAKLVQEEVRRRIEGRSELASKDSAAFKACFASACRDVLVDRARRRCAAKRGQGRRPENVTEESAIGPDRELAMLILHDELCLLGKKCIDLERYVEMHLFGGMTYREIAESVGLSESTISRQLRFAWAWLRERWEEDR